MHRVLLTMVFAWLCFAPPALAQDRTIEVKLASGKIATAAFHEGRLSQPGVIILHGFLQTRDFPTVANLAQALASAGYAVLTPTLSLGISQRNRSLPCEAVHTHSLEQDVAEVALWTRWLAGKGHKQVILVGHSFGSLQILSYVSHEPAPAVTKALLISLTDVEVRQAAPERARTVRALRERIARGDKSLVEAEFGHCRKYVSPAAALLSYATITRGSILESLSKSAVPVEAIMGGNDERMGPDWPDKLMARGIDVRVIPGANHFFDNQYEFDLHDAVLQGLAPPRTER